jgi:hypothetical protein
MASAHCPNRISSLRCGIDMEETKRLLPPHSVNNPDKSHLLLLPPPRPGDGRFDLADLPPRGLAGRPGHLGNGNENVSLNLPCPTRLSPTQARLAQASDWRGTHADLELARTDVILHNAPPQSVPHAPRGFPGSGLARVRSERQGSSPRGGSAAFRIGCRAPPGQCPAPARLYPTLCKSSRGCRAHAGFDWAGGGILQLPDACVEGPISRCLPHWGTPPEKWGKRTRDAMSLPCLRHVPPGESGRPRALIGWIPPAGQDEARARGPASQ